MPRGDGTGPMGMGSMTGRGAGICAGYAASGYENPIGYGCGFGGGRGFKRNFNATGLPMCRFGAANINRAYSSKTDEKEILKRYAQNLESQLNEVKKRISEFDNGEE